MRKQISYPMGSISSGTMRAEDLIPTFCYELEQRAKHDKHVAFKTRRVHVKIVKEIEARMADLCTDNCHDNDVCYYTSDAADWDLSDLFDALGEYAAPYFYFGAHPGDGADYGYWLSESWDEDFVSPNNLDDGDDHLMVQDLSEVPARYRGEVAVVNDHGNVSLYVKTSRGLREIWSVV